MWSPPLLEVSDPPPILILNSYLKLVDFEAFVKGLQKQSSDEGKKPDEQPKDKKKDDDDDSMAVD